jgi:uncharacterized protein
LTVALRLAESHNNASATDGDEADLVIVELAALFHDLFDSKYETVNGSSLHVETWLTTRGLSRRQTVAIVNIIENVSYSKEILRRRNGGWTAWHQECIELHCVMDADKLDAIGAFGIFRCAAYSGAKNKELYVPENDEKYANSAVGHFDDKLFKLEAMMITETGKQVAKRRTAIMREVIKKIKEEEQLLDFD